MANEFEYAIPGCSISIVAKPPKDMDLDEMISVEKGLYQTTRFELYRRSERSDIEIGFFSLSPLPGCCGIVVIHNMWLSEQTRGSGLSDPVRRLKTELCQTLGYSMMMATTRMVDIPAVGNFFKSKYKIIDTFTNKRSNNLIALGIKKI